MRWIRTRIPLQQLSIASAGVLFSACSVSSVTAYGDEPLEPVRLPLTRVQSSIVTTIVVGDQTVSAGIDTGGGQITLTEEVIRKAGGRRASGYQTGPDSSGRETRTPMFTVPAITIGGRTFHNVLVTRAEKRPEGEGPPIPNGIGRKFLGRYFVVIDYAGHFMTLWPASAKLAVDTDCGSKRLPMEPNEDRALAITQFATSAGPLRAVWDTGAQYSSIPQSLAEERMLDTFLRGQTPFYTLKSMIAAGHELGPLEFVVLPLKPPDDFQIFLGDNFFAQHVVCLDYKNREVRVH